MSEEFNQISANPFAIKRIKVKNLFGHYNYELPSSEFEGDLSKIFILYGNNGAGKSTILNLVYCLLSPVSNRGHKSFLAKTLFSFLSIKFNNDIEIIAKRDSKSLIGSYGVTIKNKSDKSYLLEVDEDLSITDSSSPDSDILIEDLLKFNIDYYYLNDKRKFETTVFEEDQEKPLTRNLGRHVRWEEWETEEKFRRFSRDERTNLLPFELKQTIRRFDKIFRQKALRGSSEGDQNINTIYTDVLDQLGGSLKSPSEIENIDFDAQKKEIINLAKRSAPFEKFGATPNFPAERILDILDKSPKETHFLILPVLKPYLDGIKARLDALKEINDILSTFSETINSFLWRKSLSFTVQDGLKIHSDYNESLNPEELSSGEQHLLLLFCNTIIARERTSIYFIDEPELSLNIKWQRNLIGALWKFTKDSQGQFILATHSIELLSQHDNNVVQLDDKNII